MENISEKVAAGESLPSGLSFKSDIEFKKDLIKKSASTLEEAKAQYDILQVKMERLDTLEETLKKEIKSYHDKLDRANTEIVEKYDRIDYQKEYYKKEKERMNELLEFLEQNRENYNKLLTSLTIKNRTKTKQLEEKETFKKLREQEKKMQENYNYIFSLQSFVDSKSNENDFSELMKECLDLQQEINEDLIKSL